MEIGINEGDFIDDEIDDVILNISEDDNESNSEINTSNQSDDIITSLLQTKGIEDKSKIKFENDEGETEEVDWDSLDNETKLNILNSSNQNPNNLDNSEIQLINAIRSSALSPEEYIQYIQKNTLNQYLQNNSLNNQIFKVDELSDDELFVTDLIARTGITEEEAFNQLDQAKSNQAVFNKQIGAIRSEYQKSEEEAIQYNEFQKQEIAQAQYNQFANQIENEIMNFTEFAGYDLNMNNEDMQELYEFITGFDTAGNSYFGKALNDPGTLIKMAWFALNGEQMIEDINKYYKKEIANVRKESYNKGLQAYKDKPSVVYKNTKSNKTKSEVYDDLDDF